MRQGDFVFYKTLLTMEPGIHLGPLRDEMHEALLRKARQGDVAAQRNLGELALIFVRGDEDYMLKIKNELNKPRSAFYLWLSKWIDVDTTEKYSPLWDETMKSVGWLKKAADAGDLQAMYVWVRRGALFYPFYKRDAWEDVPRFWDVLLERGHAQALRDAAQLGVRPSSPREWISAFPASSFLIHSHYSQDSLGKVSASAVEALQKRPDVEYRFLPKLKSALDGDCLDTAEVVELLEQIGRLYPYALFCGEYDHSRFLMRYADPAVRSHYIGMMEDVAGWGDSVAMFALADLLARGEVVEQDRARACGLLEKVWDSCGRYNCDYPFDQGKGDGDMSSLAMVAFDGLIRLYTDKASDTYDPDKAFRLAQEYLEFDDYSLRIRYRVVKRYPGVRNAHYYMGQMYEKGIGTKQDLDKALSFYQEGVKAGDYRSMLVLGTCYEKGIGVEANIEKAVECYLNVIRDSVIKKTQQLIISMYGNRA